MRVRNDYGGSYELNPTVKQLAYYTDEELHLHWDNACKDGNEIPFVKELWKRYNNKKKECEILRSQSDRAVRDLEKVRDGLLQSLKVYPSS